jgi:hypothetical protein
MARLYKGSSASSSSNAKKSGERSSGLAVPYQPVRAGGKVLGAKKVDKAPKRGKFKLKIKTIQ